jgi:glutaryl-CoA dehydrogenase
MEGSLPLQEFAMSGAYAGFTHFTDYMGLEALLTDEERMVREAARDFVNAEVLPIIEAHAQGQTFPRALIPKMGELGFFGPTLPEKYGCAGLSSVAYGLLMYELERGDSGLRSFASVQGSLVMYPIFTFGSEAQKDHWLPKLASGEAIGCFGLTEPDFGSNPSGMLTRAERMGDGTWRLNGTKMWITNGTVADVAVVWAQTEEGIRGFLVEKGAKGFSAPEMHGKWSLRASNTAELVLEDVVVDEAASLLPGAKGLKGPLSCLSQARYGIAWGVLGAADACYQCALDYSKSRIQFGKPIGAFQLQQEKLAWKPAQVSMAKMNNVNVSLEITRKARTILGANGILDEYPVMRHMANLESVYTYEGTHDIHTLIVGQEVTGLAAYE